MYDDIFGFVGVLIAIVVLLGLSLFALSVILMPFICYNGCIENYSDGERTGEIYKFSKKGIFFKSWEGEMYLGGVSSDANGSLVMDKMYFSILESDEEAKKEIISDVQQCARERATCTIQYNEWFLSPWSISSNYEVSGVIRQL